MVKLINYIKTIWDYQPDIILNQGEIKDARI